MAHVAEVVENQVETTSETPDLEQVQATNPVGRPNGKKDEIKQIPKNAERITGPAFIEFIQSLEPKDWEAYICYMYRYDPVFDNTNGGRDAKYICVFTSPFTEESIKREFGSGTYALKLNRMDPATRKSKPAMEIQITIMDPQFPPALPPGDWLEHPRNRKWTPFRPAIEAAWSKRMKDASGSTAAPAPGESIPNWLNDKINDLRAEIRRADTTPQQKDQLMASVVAILSKSLEPQDPIKTMTALKALTAGDDKSDSLERIILIKLLDKLTEKPAADPQVTVLQNELAELRKQNNQLMMKMLDQKTEQAKVPSPIEQVKAMGEVMTTLAEIMPERSSLPPWAQVVQETVPKALDLGEKFLTMNAVRNRVAPPMTTRPAVPTPITPATAVAPTPPAIAPIPVITNAAPPAATVIPQPIATENVSVEMDMMQKTILMMVAQNAAPALQLGMSGEEFADRVIDRIGIQTYEEFVRDHPKEQLIPLLTSIPEVWAILQPYEVQLPAFINGFYTPPEDEPDEEPAPAPAPIAAAAVSPGPRPVKSKKGSKK